MRSIQIMRRAKTGTARLALFMSCILVLGCSPLLEGLRGSQTIGPQCVPSFPYKGGWYGGDGAYSVGLDDRRTLWLFGDTFVSPEAGRQDRVDMGVVLGTTLAISTCTAEGGFEVQYYLKRKNGEFVSSFGENDWLWPQDPFLVDGMLYVPLVAVRANPAIQGPFKFEVAGHKMARIKNPGAAHPDQWIVDYTDLSPGIPKGILAFATTSFVDGGYVYFYPFYAATDAAPGAFGNILARIPIGALHDPAAAIRYLDKDRGWVKDLNPSTAKIVLDAGVSELSVRYHSGIGKWIAVYMSPRNNGDQLLYRTAEKPEGPWTEPKALIQAIPEVDPKSPRYDRNNFCYAGKEHISFARNGIMIATYVCNSFEDPDKETSFIRKNLFLYRPVVNVLKY